MSKCNTSDRWPVIYDSSDLKNQIKSIIDKKELFYQDTSKMQKILCQGDVIYLEKDFLYYDEDGEPAFLECSNYWVIIGNTCDIQREITDLKYTQIVPLFELTEINDEILKDLENYQSFKKFYYQKFEEKHFILDFTQACTIEKSFLIPHSTKIKELTFVGWLLFHCCIVRYLARDDGRKD